MGNAIVYKSGQEFSVFTILDATETLSRFSCVVKIFCNGLGIFTTIHPKARRRFPFTKDLLAGSSVMTAFALDLNASGACGSRGLALYLKASMG